MSTSKQRSVLITGSSSGIGLCAAEGLKARGYRVFATARKAQDVDALTERGLESLLLDLTDSDSIREALAAVLERTGGELYGLFNNGGYGQPGAVEDLSRDVLRQQFETNVFGWHELTCAVLPVMRRRNEGRIVQNSSMLGLVTLAYRGAYNASKFALEGLTDTLRQELRGSGIHVSLIEPGPVESRFRENAYAAFKRNIDPGQSAHAAVYQEVEQRLAQTAEPPFTLPASSVLKKLIHALESPNPRPRYYVTVPTYVFAGLKRVLSSRSLDAVMAWIARRDRESR